MLFDEIIYEQVVKDLQIDPVIINQTLNLLLESYPIAFLIHYRRDLIGGLNTSQLRKLTLNLNAYLQFLERKKFILSKIKSNEIDISDLENQIQTTKNKDILADCYFAYKYNEKNKNRLIKNMHLKPLFDLLLTSNLVFENEAGKYLNENFTTIDSVASGVKEFLIDKVVGNFSLWDIFREYLWQNGMIVCTPWNKPSKNFNYIDFYKFKEPIKAIHFSKGLILLRGRKEHILKVTIEALDQDNFAIDSMIKTLQIKDFHNLKPIILEVIKYSWKEIFLPKLQTELLARFREKIDSEAIYSFSQNLKNLLLTAKAGEKNILSIFLTPKNGAKIAVIDKQGSLLDYSCVYINGSQNWHDNIATLAKLIIKHKVELISLGNGLGYSEADRLIRSVIETYPDLRLERLIINEICCLNYAHSIKSQNEFPDLEPGTRAAIILARRTQDPLAEIVKMDPETIIFNQYQNDVNPNLLNFHFRETITECVSIVGADINLASFDILKYIPGLNDQLAQNIINYRFEHGAIKAREELLKIKGFNNENYKFAAGFLYVFISPNKLDHSRIHPESYALALQIQADLAANSQNPTNQKNIQTKYSKIENNFSNIKKIIYELDKPHRNKQLELKPIKYNAKIKSFNDLEKQMTLPGMVVAVTSFGALIDVGVHQLGLIHLSELTKHYIRNPFAIIQSGKYVNVKIIELDALNNRINLTMHLEKQPGKNPIQKLKINKSKPSNQNLTSKKREGNSLENKTKKMLFNTTMADALNKIKKDL